MPTSPPPPQLPGMLNAPHHDNVFKDFSHLQEQKFCHTVGSEFFLWILRLPQIYL